MAKFELNNTEFNMVLGLLEVAGTHITRGSAAWEEYQQLLSKLRLQNI